MTWFLWLIMVFFVGIGILLIIYGLRSASSDPASHRYTQPSEYYLYVPSAYTSEKAWPLFIGIHGSGGSGLDCWNMWQAQAEADGYILLCPSLADANGGWFQESGEGLLFNILKQVKAKYRIGSRYYFAGFSAGAQFVQGMVFRFPGLVQGAAVLSAGSYRPLSPSSVNIPLLVVTGDRDNPDSVRNYHSFVGALRADGFKVTNRVFPGVGHEVTPEIISLVLEHYRQVYGQ